MKLKSQELLRILPLIMLLFNFSCSIKSEIITDSPKKSETIINTQQDRDLSKYDKGGVFDCNRYNSQANCEKKKFNEFIWQHWTEKKLGYLEAKYNVSPDASHTVKAFIEPMKNGQWHIVWIRTESYLSNGRPVSNSRDFSITSLEKVESKPEKDDWSLQFKDKSGERVENPTDFYF